MCRYTPACEEFISREPEARGIYHKYTSEYMQCIADIYTNWPWFICYVKF